MLLLLVIDKQLLEYINSSYKYTEVLQVFGESMEPDVKEGSLVFVDKSRTELDNRGMYLVNTQDGLFIKKLNVNNDKVTLKSINKGFHDMQFNRSDIEVVGMVRGLLIKV